MEKHSKNEIKKQIRNRQQEEIPEKGYFQEDHTTSKKPNQIIPELTSKGAIPRHSSTNQMDQKVMEGPVKPRRKNEIFNESKNTWSRKRREGGLGGKGRKKEELMPKIRTPDRIRKGKTPGKNPSQSRLP